MKRLLLLASVFILLFMGSMSVSAETLTVSDATGVPGEMVTVTITLGNNVTGVAGAAFTLNYDNSLSLSEVRSDFFPLFTTQGITSGPVTVDSVEYYKALVVNYSEAMIAAAKAAVTPPTEDEVLFELDFLISGNATEGNHTIEIVPSILSNTAAGYPETGQEIAMLVGISGENYPEIPVTNTSAEGAGTISVVPFDSDQDGIADSWERFYVPGGSDLTVFTASGDYDNDGYSDYQEYLNRNEIDLEGNSYDPQVKNAPSGTGYIRNVRFLPGIYLLLTKDGNQ